MNWLDSLDGLWRDYYTCSFQKEDSAINDDIPLAALSTKLAECTKPTLKSDSSGSYAPLMSKYIASTPARSIKKELKI
ncbi:MAG: hypothetical protein SGJ10_06435 [Bacteroidota bacterium]|nr:hypothetical protein [Bacteroidota bacterium]